MFSRTWTRWLVPLAVVAVCALGIAFANHRSSSFSETRGVASGGTRIPFLTSKKRSGPRPATAYPKTDPSQPGATTWIKYPADDELPHGLGIGVCDGVIVGVVSEDPKHPDYELMCTRYVVGDLDATDITMPLWRSLDFEMPKPDGSIAELSVLRPLWWIEETGAKAGETIDLAMHEIGISGMARVVKIGPCEVDSRDNEKGMQVVTGTIKHHNAEVWDLVFNNNAKTPLGVTSNHPIYSDDRDDWVPAGELKINEKARTIEGTATLTSKFKRPGRETVYNLEVHRSHAYHVSQFGILAHNSSILHCGAPLNPRTRFVAGAEIPSHGQVISRGTVDLKPTIDRINAGQRFPHRNDASIFRNAEGRLPQQPHGYYREYVVPTNGISGPGPQRLVIGQNGEIFYTPDHYLSFVPIQ